LNTLLKGLKGPFLKPPKHVASRVVKG